MTAFLLTLATAKRNSEVHAFSADVAFSQGHSDATLSFLPAFIAKTTRLDRLDNTLDPITVPALASSISDDLPDRTLCPVRSLRYYLDLTSGNKDLKYSKADPRPKRLFVSYKPGHRKDIYKTTVSGWIKATIREAYQSVKDEDIPHLSFPDCQARELRAIATSLAFHQHHSLRQVMQAATWRNTGTFASFYLRDIPSLGVLSSLGPIVAAQVTLSGSHCPP